MRLQLDVPVDLGAGFEVSAGEDRADVGADNSDWASWGGALVASLALSRRTTGVAA